MTSVTTPSHGAPHGAGTPQALIEAAIAQSGPWAVLGRALLLVLQNALTPKPRPMTANDLPLYLRKDVGLDPAPNPNSHWDLMR